MDSFNREDLAWAAGFFDGEGHTGVWYGKNRRDKYGTRHRSGHIYTLLRISQADDWEVLDKFRRAVGLGKITGPYNMPSGKLLYHYTVNGFENVQAVIAMIWFKLGDVKREQAAKALRLERENHYDVVRQYKRGK